VPASELAESIDACTLCGACEPACPEDMALVDMITGLRARLATAVPQRLSVHGTRERAPVAYPGIAKLLIPDRALAASGALMALLAKGWPGMAMARDIGEDLALAIESGAAISEHRREQFLAPLRAVRALIVGDGLLLRALRRWLPGANIVSQGEALSRRAAAGLRPGDFYVIEARAYHADRERLVAHYDALRRQSGCGMNLDLQRLALSTTAGSLATAAGRSRVDGREQARWMLEGRVVSRVIVEDAGDIALFSAVSRAPVKHVAELAAGH
jgi:ferredoxin